jgi:hypothetical protein
MAVEYAGLRRPCTGLRTDSYRQHVSTINYSALPRAGR